MVAETTKWLHSRKGVIEGTIVRESEEWVDIRLSGAQTLRTSRGRHSDGEILTVRKSFIREVED